jgi:hypothetical protein
MNAAMPSDTLYLWHLSAPAAPVLVGELNLVLNRLTPHEALAEEWCCGSSARARSSAAHS